VEHLAEFMPQPPITLDGKQVGKLGIFRAPVRAASPTARGQQKAQASMTKDDLSKDTLSQAHAPSAVSTQECVDMALLQLPHKGILEFSFGSLSKPPAIGEALSNPLFLKLYSELSNKNNSVTAFKEVLVSVLQGNVINCSQTSKLISIPSSHNDEDFRSLILATVFTRISDPNHWREQVCQHSFVSATEVAHLQDRIGLVAWAFTALNPTGRYTLHLNQEMHRSVALALMAFTNREHAWEQEQMTLKAGRLGGPRVKVERVWRNATYNGSPHSYAITWALPRQGILKLDFVQITKPSDLYAPEQYLLLELTKTIVVKEIFSESFKHSKQP